MANCLIGFNPTAQGQFWLIRIISYIDSQDTKSDTVCQGVMRDYY